MMYILMATMILALISGVIVSKRNKEKEKKEIRKQLVQIKMMTYDNDIRFKNKEISSFDYLDTLSIINRQLTQLEKKWETLGGE